MSWHLTPPGQITEHFAYNEADCRCCQRIVSKDAVRQAAEMMEGVRRKLGDRPIRVLSWCRCVRHNRAVGGALDSYHMRGLAVDFVVKGLTPAQVQTLLMDHEGGMGSYSGFTHLDLGPKRRWSD